MMQRSDVSRERARNLSLAVTTVAMMLFGACGGGGAPDEGQTSSPAVKQPSLVLISVDGLGADDVGCYGAEPSLTSALDAFSQGAHRFDFAFTQSPDASPALASLYTSMYPTSHGLVAEGESLRDEAETAAELFSSQGLATAWFSIATDEPPASGVLQGFEIVSTDGVAAAGDWLSEHSSAPFFMAFHLPKLTDAGAVDHTIGELLEVLGGEELMARTVVAVVGTRGAAPGPETEALALPVVHVPMLLREPGASAATTIPQFVELIDLMPTLSELAGVPAPASAQGASLVPLIRGNGQPPYVAFGESFGDHEHRFAALGGHRLVRDVTSDQVHLYNIVADPSESTDIAAESGSEQALRRMQSDLEAWAKMVSAASLDPERRSEELDEETLEQLKSLGYIQ